MTSEDFAGNFEGSRFSAFFMFSHMINAKKIKKSVTKPSFLRLTCVREEVSSSELRKIVSFLFSASVFLCDDDCKKPVICGRNHSKYIF